MILEENIDNHLTRLNHEYEKITDEKRKFIQLQEKALERKNSQYKTLRSDRDALQKAHSQVDNDQVRKEDAEMEEQLRDQLERLRDIRDELGQERESSIDNKKQLAKKRDEIAHANFAMGGEDALYVHRKRAAKKVQAMKSRVLVTQREADQLVSSRQELRRQIRHEVVLRRRFREDYDRASRNSKKNQKVINEIVDNSYEAFEETSRINQKLANLKEKYRREARQLNQRTRDMERQLNGESELKRFVMIKNKSRQASGENNELSRRLSRAFKTYEVTPEMIEDLLGKIKTITQQTTANGMVQTFQTRESAIMSLLSYVTNSSKDADEAIVELNAMLREETRLVHRLDVIEAARVKQSTLIDENLTQTRTDLESIRSQLNNQSKLDEKLMEKIKILAQDIVLRSDSLGDDNSFLDGDIDANNIDDYLNALEIRICEIKGLFDYLVSHSDTLRLQIADDDELPLSKKKPKLRSALNDFDRVSALNPLDQNAPLFPPNFFTEAELANEIMDPITFKLVTGESLNRMSHTDMDGKQSSIDKTRKRQTSTTQHQTSTGGHENRSTLEVPDESRETESGSRSSSGEQAIAAEDGSESSLTNQQSLREIAHVYPSGVASRERDSNVEMSFEEFQDEYGAE